MILSALSVGEKFSLGGITTLLGLGMTFIVLVILIGCILLINLLVKKTNSFMSTRKSGKNAAKSDETAAAVNRSAAGTEIPDEAISPETMLAIEAVVKTYLREDGGNGKPHENIRIKSVTKK